MRRWPAKCYGGEWEWGECGSPLVVGRGRRPNPPGRYEVSYLDGSFSPVISVPAASENEAEQIAGARLRVSPEILWARPARKSRALPGRWRRRTLGNPYVYGWLEELEETRGLPPPELEPWVRIRGKGEHREPFSEGYTAAAERAGATYPGGHPKEGRPMSKSDALKARYPIPGYVTEQMIADWSSLSPGTRPGSRAYEEAAELLGDQAEELEVERQRNPAGKKASPRKASPAQVKQELVAAIKERKTHFATPPWGRGPNWIKTAKRLDSLLTRLEKKLAGMIGVEKAEAFFNKEFWKDNPGDSYVHPLAYEARDRYRADLAEPGHQDAAEYWRGQAGAFFTGNPPKYGERGHRMYRGWRYRIFREPDGYWLTMPGFKTRIHDGFDDAQEELFEHVDSLEGTPHGLGKGNPSGLREWIK